MGLKIVMNVSEHKVPKLFVVLSTHYNVITPFSVFVDDSVKSLDACELPHFCQSDKMPRQKVISRRKGLS